MREIKFRAWHKGNEEMVNFDNQKASRDVFQSSAMVRLMAGDESGVLMQYTGLKDKNGVEIYEGDIVTYPNPKCFGVVEFGEYQNGRGDTFEKGNGFHIEAKEESAQGSFYGRDIKVIGSIYENPELLKGG